MKEDRLDQHSVSAEEKQSMSVRAGACYNSQALLMGEEKQKVVLPIPYIWKSGGRLVQWSKSGVTWTQDQVCEGRKRESRSRKGLGITDGKLTWNLGNE